MAVINITKENFAQEVLHRLCAVQHLGFKIFFGNGNNSHIGFLHFFIRTLCGGRSVPSKEGVILTYGSSIPQSAPIFQR